jgi:outer membrane protein TolC
LKLQQELYDKVKLDFSLGGATLNDLIIAQRSFTTAQTTAVSAQAAYSHARIALDQVLGETLERNHVSVSDALAGRTSYVSKLRSLATRRITHSRPAAD